MISEPGLAGRRAFFKSIIPGVTICIMKLLTSDDKLLQSLIMTNLNCLSLMVCGYLEPDGQLEQESDHEMCTKIRVALKSIVKFLMSHNSIQIRKSLLSFCSTLLTVPHSRFIREVFDVLVDVPLTYSHDPEEDIRRTVDDLVLNGDEYVEDILIGKVIQCLKSLKQELALLRENEIHERISFLTAAVKKLSPSGWNSFLERPQHRIQIMHTFRKLCQMNPEYSVGARIRPFAYVKNEHSLKALDQLLQVIAVKSNGLILTDLLVDYLRQSNGEFAFFSMAVFILKHIERPLPASFEGISNDILSREYSNPGLIELSKIQLAIETCVLYQKDSNSIHSKVEIDLLFNIEICACFNHMREYCLEKEEELSQLWGYSSRHEMISDGSEELSLKTARSLQLSLNIPQIPGVVKSLLDCTHLADLIRFKLLIEVTLDILDESYYTSPNVYLQILAYFLKFIRTKCPERPQLHSPDREIQDAKTMWINFLKNSRDANLTNDSEGNILPLSHVPEESPETNAEYYYLDVTKEVST